MKKKIVDPSMPVGRLRQVHDFLPRPEDLVMPEKQVKVTISLNKHSVDFFKAEAKKHHTKYQRMIRELLDLYAVQYKAA